MTNLATIKSAAKFVTTATDDEINEIITDHYSRPASMQEVKKDFEIQVKPSGGQFSKTFAYTNTVFGPLGFHHKQPASAIFRLAARIIIMKAQR